jgi:Ca2+-binding RTX toxin-like protein
VTAYLNDPGATELRVGRGGDAEGDILTGVERLVGSNHDDQLFGNSSDNELQGGWGGNDVLTGGAGHDMFIFGRGDGMDRVTDFTVGQDVIDIRRFDPAHLDQQVTTLDGTEGLLLFSAADPGFGSLFLEHVTTELHWRDGHLLV